MDAAAREVRRLLVWASGFLLGETARRSAGARAQCFHSVAAGEQPIVSAARVVSGSVDVNSQISLLVKLKLTNCARHG
jgi:hypothetical protein